MLSGQEVEEDLGEHEQGKKKYLQNIFYVIISKF